MVRRLLMSDEMHDWLANLTTGDPAAATPVAAALTALLGEAANLGPPTVRPLTSVDPGEDPGAVIDEVYERGLAGPQSIRREVATVDTARHQLEQRIARLEASGRRDELPGLRVELAQIIADKQAVDKRSQRAQLRLDAFRNRKEALKARLSAARAERDVYTALAGLEGGGEESDAAIAAAEAKARDIEQEIRQEISEATSVVSGATAPGLMELRVGDPGESEIHLIFAVEPADAVLLISVLEGRDAWRDHHDEAIALSREVLRSVREAREATARRYDGGPAFLTEFFPAGAGRIEAAAAELIAHSQESPG